jgi:WD40 repeat protein
MPVQCALGIPHPGLKECRRAGVILALALIAASIQGAAAQGSPEIVWQGSHASSVTFTAFSPDGQQLATGGDDRKDNLWNAADGTLIRSITQCGGIGCRGSTFGFFSPDGQQLATAGIKFWNVADGTLARTLGIGGTIALSPDWQYIASSVTVSNYPSQTRSIALVRSSDDSQIWNNPNAGGGATVFAPDGQSLATIGFAGVDILRVADGSLIRTIVGPRGGSLVYSHDGQFLATNGGSGGSFQWDDTIKIYRVADGALLRTFSGTGVVTSIVFTPDDQTLIASSYDNNYDPVNGWIPSTGAIRFWRLSDGALFKTYDQNTGAIAKTLSVSPDGQFFSYAHDSTVFVARVPAATCVASISPGSANLPTNGGSGVVNVSAPAGCTWKAVSRVSWIKISGPATGTGDGVVSYTASNSSDSGMTGLLIIAEQTFPIQLGANPCTYTVTPGSSSWSADGGTGAVGVQTAGGCGWTAQSNDSWITITKISRDNGGGGVTYSVAPSDTSRTGTLTVAGQTVTVVQDINACRYTLSPTSQSIGSSGGLGNFSVTTTSDCPWMAKSNASWVTVTGGTGPGTGIVDYSVIQNESGLSRTATIQVADKSFTIVQPGGSASSPTPTPTATAIATPTATVAPSPTAAAPTPTATPNPSATATATVSPSATVSSSPTPSTTPNLTASPSPNPTPLVTPTSTPTAEPTASSSPTPSPTPSATATASSAPVPQAQPLNIATRGRVEAGNSALIGGFIITGNQTKKVVIRAIGPSLQSSLPNALPDPVLELHSSDGSFLRQNDNWRDDSAQAAELVAKQIAPAHELESAIVAILAPGTYTAMVRGNNNASGVGLVEVYDVTTEKDSRLANISTRGVVESDENVLIGGFILGGASGNAKILIRAIGPSLASAGVSNAASNPALELRDGNGVVLQSNDNWKDRQRAEIEATHIPPTMDSEAALIAELPSGTYTAIVSSKGSSGVALIEVYALP